MFCKHCGATLEDEAKFCPNCGHTLSEDEPVKEEAPAKPVLDDDDEPTGIKKGFLLIGAIIAFVSALVSVGMFFLSGLVDVAGDPFKYSTISDYLDFSAEGIFTIILDAFKAEDITQAIEGIMNLIISFIIVFATIIALVIEAIKALIAFIRAIKGNYSKGLKPAIGAFTSYAVGMLLFFSINGGEGVKFSTVTLIGLCVAAILVGVYLVMHAFANGKNSLRLSFLLKLIFAAGSIVIGGVIAGLAAGPVFVVNDINYSFTGLFIDSLGGLIGGTADTTKFIYLAIGFVSVMILINLGMEVIKKAVLGVGSAVDGKSFKKTSLVAAIASLIFSAALIAAEYLYADGLELDPAIPIVIAVFSLLGVVLCIIESKLMGKLTDKK